MIEEVKTTGTYSWKSFSESVIVDDLDPSVIDLFNHKIKEAELSIHHTFDHNFVFTLPYRRYRRGKSRCLICGYKLGTKEHKPFEIEEK